MTTQLANTQDLVTRYRTFRTDHPKARTRDAADALGVGEAAIVALGCGNGVTRLKGPWPDVIAAAPSLGRVMALTRNGAAVHERWGTYGALKLNGHVGLVLGEDIDLRIFFGEWSKGFAVEETTPKGLRRSLQFFDRTGTAVHKIFLDPDGDSAAFQRIVAASRDGNQSADEACLAATAATARATQAPSADALRTAWAALQDTHDFHPMLRRLEIGRLAAFRLAGDDFARQASANAASRLLEGAAQLSLPIMVFVGNRGMIQIHTGPVSTTKRIGPWFNVLDTGFNLHLREDQIASSWIVRKPTRDGDVNSLEIMDEAGELIVSFFGKRKPGQAEDPAWRRLLAAVGSAA